MRRRRDGARAVFCALRFAAAQKEAMWVCGCVHTLTVELHQLFHIEGTRCRRTYRLFLEACLLSHPVSAQSDTNRLPV